MLGIGDRFKSAGSDVKEEAPSLPATQIPRPRRSPMSESALLLIRTMYELVLYSFCLVRFGLGKRGRGEDWEGG